MSKVGETASALMSPLRVIVALKLPFAVRRTAGTFCLRGLRASKVDKPASLRVRKPRRHPVRAAGVVHRSANGKHGARGVRQANRQKLK